MTDRLRWFTAVSFCILAIGCESIPSDAADVTFSQPVGRITNDRDADLVDALVAKGMLDDAEAICTAALKGSDALSVSHAKWTVRLARVLSQRALSTDDYDDEQTDAVSKPIRQLQKEYADHPWILFLDAALLQIRWDAARHDVVIAAVTPSGNDRTTRALKRITSLDRDISDLSAKIDESRNAREKRSDGDRASSGLNQKADLVRLQQELLVTKVSMQLLQTELFDSNSRDSIAAATATISAAREAVAQLPADCQARREIERLQIQAILRSGDPQRAHEKLDEHRQSYRAGQTFLLDALELRIRLAGGLLDKAKRIHDAAVHSSIPSSVELDLARLEYLIAAKDQGVGGFLEEIEQRWGAYARRRAEAISLKRLRADQSGAAVNPSLVAAQGQDWLRRGNAERAAELLTAAARAEMNDDQSLQYTREAAAALTSIKRIADAARLLSAMAIERRRAKTAAATQFQAAFAYASTGDAGLAQSVEQSLRDTIEYWPSSEAAEPARKWLVKLLTEQKRFAEAAVTAMANGTKADQFDIYSLWRNAIQSTDDVSRRQIGKQLANSFQERLGDAKSAGMFRKLAAVLLDPDQLVGLPPAGKAEEPFMEKLLDFRRSPGASKLVPNPNEAIVQDVRWRLMQDGRQDKRHRRAIASLIDSWNLGQLDSYDDAMRLVWSGDIESAIAMLRRMINRSESPGLTLRNAAQMLGESGENNAMTVAARMWEELASGTPKGSSQWHEAKLSAIDLLSSIQHSDEAARRAKYILLTSPPKDEQLRKRYESYDR